MVLESVNEIVDNSPNSVWSSDKINQSLASIDNVISTGLDSQNLSINGTQTIYGQKTFNNMFIADTTALSYDRAMSHLQNDMSPMTNTGGKGISTDINKELNFSKDNVSGVSCPLASRLPVYRNADIYIGWGISGSTTIDYKCNNIIIPKIPIPFSVPDIGTNTTKFNLGAFPNDYTNIITSVSVSGTMTASISDYLTLTLFCIYTDKGESGVVLTGNTNFFSNHRLQLDRVEILGSSSFIGDIVGYKRLGFFIFNSGADSSFKENEKITTNNNLYFFNNTSSIAYFYSVRPSDIVTQPRYAETIKSDVIVEYQGIERFFALQGFVPSFKYGKNLYTYETFTSRRYSQASKEIKVPLKYNANANTFYNIYGDTNVTWNSDGYNFNYSSQLRRITYFN